MAVKYGAESKNASEALHWTDDRSVRFYHRRLILKPLNGKFKETIMMGSLQI